MTFTASTVRALMGDQDRQFGLIIGSAVLILTAALTEDVFMLLCGLAVSLWFYLQAIFFAPSLKIARVIWVNCGMKLGIVVSPLILSLMFVLAICPTAFIVKLLGANLLGTNNTGRETYWVKRTYKMQSLKSQF